MMQMKVIILFVLLLLPAPALAADSGHAGTLYKDPNCGCCEDYAKYLRGNGYQLTVVATDELPDFRRQQGASEHLAGCHMMLTGGYVIEGHVPVAMIDRLLKERPDIKGISLPGMPMGSPGMSGKKTGPFTVLEITADKSDAAPRVFGVE